MQQAALFADAFPAPARPLSAHQLAVDGWTWLWREARGEAWRWAPIDLRHVRNCLKFRAGGDAQLFLDRARRLLLNPPSAWLAQNASPALLYSKWNELAATIVPASRDQRNLSALQRAALEL